MPAELAELVIDDVSLPELEERWSINRTSLKNRAKLLGVQLIRESSTKTVWPGDKIELGDRYHQHLRTGGNSTNFQVDPSQRVKRSKGGALSTQAAGADGVTMQAFVQELKRQLRPTKPTERAMELKLMASEELQLTGPELSDLLGYNVGAHFDGQTRFGYRFWREENNDGSRFKHLWRCQRC